MVITCLDGTSQSHYDEGNLALSLGSCNHCVVCVVSDERELAGGTHPVHTSPCPPGWKPFVTHRDVEPDTRRLLCETGIGLKSITKNGCRDGAFGRLSLLACSLGVLVVRYFTWWALAR